MKEFLNKILGLSVATWLCCLLSVGSIVLACMGATRAGEWMSTWPNLAGVTLLTIAVAVSGIRALFRKRFHSALFHVGCALIMAGWLIGRYAVRTETRDHPVTGMMAMIDGDVSSELFTGSRLETIVGRVPFIVRLEKFVVERYPSREPGYEGPVREYRSEVTIQEKGKPPRRENIRVNHPAVVQGYYIYQMSWGQTQDRMGRSVNYTVLQFIRDPGLPMVYTGFAVLFAGAFWFAARFFRVTKGASSCI
jgi:cytochrome c biogenesis protein ResB